MAGYCAKHIVQLLRCRLFPAECNHRPRHWQASWFRLCRLFFERQSSRAGNDTRIHPHALEARKLRGCRFSRSTPTSPGVLGSWRPASPRTLTRAWSMPICAICSPSWTHSMKITSHRGSGRSLQAHRPLLDAARRDQPTHQPLHWRVNACISRGFSSVKEVLS